MKFKKIILMLILMLTCGIFASCAKDNITKDLNDDDTIEAWEEVFEENSTALHAVNVSNIEINSLDDFKNLSQNLTNYRNFYKKIYNAITGANLQTEPYIKISLNCDINFNNKGIQVIDLTNVEFYGNGHIIRNFVLIHKEETDEYLGNYEKAVYLGLFKNAISIYDLNVFLGYQHTSALFYSNSQDELIMCSAFINCLKIENCEVRGFLSINCVDTQLKIQPILISLVSANIPLKIKDLYNTLPAYIKDDFSGNDIILKENRSVGRLKFSISDLESGRKETSINYSGLCVLSDMINDTDTISLKVLADNCNVNLAVTIDALVTAQSISGVLSGGLTNEGYCTELNVSNSFVCVDLNAIRLNGNFKMGGIAEIVSKNSSVYNCDVNLNVNLNNEEGTDLPTEAFLIAGICGISEGKILNSECSLSLVSTKLTDVDLIIGGLSAKVLSTSEIVNCKANVDIDLNNTEYYSDQITPDIIVGGLAGIVYGGTIDFCIANGDINVIACNRVILGGVVGAEYKAQMIKNLCNTNILAKNNMFTYVADFVGVAYGGIFDGVLTTGNVEVEAKDSDDNQKICVGLIFNYPFKTFIKTEEDVIKTENEFILEVKKEYEKTNGTVTEIIVSESGIKNAFGEIYTMKCVPALANILITSTFKLIYNSNLNSLNNIINNNEYSSSTGSIQIPAATKRVSLNGLWASGSDAMDINYTYNSHIIFNNIHRSSNSIITFYNDTAGMNNRSLENYIKLSGIVSPLAQTELTETDNRRFIKICSFLNINTEVLNWDIFQPLNFISFNIHQTKSYYETVYANNKGSSTDLKIENLGDLEMILGIGWDKYKIVKNESSGTLDANYSYYIAALMDLDEKEMARNVLLDVLKKNIGSANISGSTNKYTQFIAYYQQYLRDYDLTPLTDTEYANYTNNTLICDSILSVFNGQRISDHDKNFITDLFTNILLKEEYRAVMESTAYNLSQSQLKKVYNLIWEPFLEGSEIDNINILLQMGNIFNKHDQTYDEEAGLYNITTLNKNEDVWVTEKENIPDLFSQEYISGKDVLGLTDMEYLIISVLRFDVFDVNYLYNNKFEKYGISDSPESINNTLSNLDFENLSKLNKKLVEVITVDEGETTFGFYGLDIDSTFITIKFKVTDTESGENLIYQLMIDRGNYLSLNSIRNEETEGKNIINSSFKLQFYFKVMSFIPDET